MSMGIEDTSDAQYQIKLIEIKQSYFMKNITLTVIRNFLCTIH